MTDQPLVSVIVTTYSAERLPDVFDLLLSLRRQTYPRLEILFVGERSPALGEAVGHFAAAHGMRNVCTLFNEGDTGLSEARNVAVAASRGEILAFLDDDVVTESGWAAHVVEALRDDAVIGVTGPAAPLWDDPAMSWFPEEFHWILSCTAWTGWDRARDVRNAWGMNMAFKRGAFDAAGMFSGAAGYHRGLFAEDNDFSHRVRKSTGKRIVFEPDAKVWHRVHRFRATWAFMRDRAYYIGRSRRNLVRAYGNGTGSREFLTQEHDLLRRILARRIPLDLLGLFREPALAVRRLGVTLWVLFFVGLGYCARAQVLPRAGQSASGVRPAMADVAASSEGGK